MQEPKTKRWYHYALFVIAFFVVIVFSYGTLPHIPTFVAPNHQVGNRTVIVIKENNSIVCDPNARFRLDVPRSEYTIEVNKKLLDCHIPEKDSRDLASKLDFMWRHR